MANTCTLLLLGMQGVLRACTQVVLRGWLPKEGREGVMWVLVSGCADSESWRVSVDQEFCKQAEKP